VAYVVLKEGRTPSKELEAELKALVRERIGPTAVPEEVIFVPDLPKTRSGKIMRRILKALLINAPVGDTSTLLNPEAVETLKQALASRKAQG
jgi:acetyl-CoA synthetase